MVGIVVSLMVDPWYNSLMAGDLMIDGLMVGLEVGLMAISWLRV